MALSFSTGMTLISNADSTANWAAYRIAGGGGAPAAAVADDFIEGTGSVQAKLAGNGWDSGLIFDYYTANGNSVLNLSTPGNEVLAMWISYLVPPFLETMKNGGLYILVQSSTETTTSAPTKYAKWYIGGSDVPTSGWKFVMVDTRKTPSATAGGWVAGTDLAITRRIAFGVVNKATIGQVKGEPGYCDAMWYGRPVYAVGGDGLTTCDWGSFINDSIEVNKNGLFKNIGGAYKISCGIQIGTADQTGATTFDEATGKQIIFQRHLYYGATTTDSLNYGDYYFLKGDGKVAGGKRTFIGIGDVVGAGDDRQGLLGGGIRLEDQDNMTWGIDLQTSKDSLSSVNLYGLDIIGAKGGISLDNNPGGTETDLVSVAFINCGEIDPGTSGGGSSILSCVIIDPAVNRGLRFPNVAHLAKKLSFITSGVPLTQHLAHLIQSVDYTIEFNAMNFFGDFGSATIWHGENSGNSADVIISATNLTNASQDQFENTGSPVVGSVSVSNNVTLSVTVKDVSGNNIQNARAGIFRTSDGSEIMNALTNASGLASTTFNYPGSDVPVSVRVRKGSASTTKYVPVDSSQVIGGNGLSVTITLIEDTTNTA